MDGAGEHRARQPRFSVAKFAPPAGVQRAVARNDLIAELDRGARAGVCLVIGSAGAGKTNLLVQWAETRLDGDVCWINVDAADRDPARFWKAVVHAVGALHPGFGEEAVGLIDIDGIVGPNAIASLIDDFALLPRPISLVLDDLHLAPGDIDGSLRQMLRRRPSTLGVMIGSRSDPPIDVGPLRVADGVVEVRDRDLLLQRHEAEQVLVGLGVVLDGADLDVLMNQTEGWAAGIHLAGVALARTDDRAGFVRRLGASNEVIAHYLSTQVLDAQPPEVLEFLIDTCVVDELTPELAVVLSGSSSVSLYDVEAANLLLFRNSAHPEVFRYHHLLLHLLRIRLTASDPERERRLHRTAADWCTSNGDLAGAFHHLWRADDRAAAMQLVASNVYDGYVANSLPTLGASAITLTDDDVLHSPGASVGVAVGLCGQLQFGEADRVVRRIERLALDRLDEPELAELCCARTFIAAGVCDMESVVGHAEQAFVLASHSGASSDGLAVAAGMLVKAHAWAGRWAEAETASQRVDVSGPVSVGSIEMTGALANLEIFQGRLGAGIAHARRNRDLVASAGTRRRGPESNGVALLGIGLLERGDVAVAEALFLLLHDPDDLGRIPPRVVAYVGMSRIHHARGDFAAAAGSLEAARSLVANLDESSWVVTHINSWAARQRCALGDLEWCSKLGDTLPDGVMRSLVKSRVSLADGDLREAHEHIERAREQSDCIRSDLEVALAQLRWTIAAGDDNDEAAGEVMSIASREGFVFALAESGGDVLDAIQRRARRMPRTDFIDVVLKTVPHAATAAPTAPNVDALSEREQLVLRFLVTSMSYREIAAEMYVSVNTLKTHVKNTFRKLHASSRDEALANARAAGYL